MIHLVQSTLQFIAIGCFAGLTLIGAINKDWNFGFLMNMSLVLLYAAIYLKPIK
jgi:hypothetical protein